MSTTFHANGKLLLTGEYAVLDGAKALAVPTKLGQSLHIKKQAIKKKEVLVWQSVDCHDVSWFKGTFNAETLATIDATDSKVAQKLVHLLQYCVQKNSSFAEELAAAVVTMKLEFERDWGLGSSSTLVYLLAQWANIDPYELQFEVFGGSGYDIACAGAESAIFYQKLSNEVKVESANYSPSFSHQLYFVYLGQKQNSRSGIAHYREVAKADSSIIKKVTQFTDRFYHAKKLQELEQVIEELEAFMSHILQLPTAKSTHFPDYWGAVKSLGAWGGDFVLIISDRGEAATRRYFMDKGKSVFLRFDDLILK